MKQNLAKLIRAQKAPRAFDFKKLLKWCLIGIPVVIIGFLVVNFLLGFGLILAYMIGSGWKCEWDVKHYPADRIKQEIMATEEFFTSQLKLVKREEHFWGANCKDHSEIGTSIASAKAAYSYETNQSQPEFFAAVKTLLKADGWEHNAIAGGLPGQTTLMFFNKKIGKDSFSLNYYWDNVISERGYWCEEKENNMASHSAFIAPAHTVCVNIEHTRTD